MATVEEILPHVLQGLRTGKYHLLLGAGASLGCENPFGPLPMATALTDQILDDLGYDEKKRDLARALVRDAGSDSR